MKHAKRKPIAAKRPADSAKPAIRCATCGHVSASKYEAKQHRLATGHYG